MTSDALPEPRDLPVAAAAGEGGEQVPELALDPGGRSIPAPRPHPPRRGARDGQSGQRHERATGAAAGRPSGPGREHGRDGRRAPSGSGRGPRRLWQLLRSRAAQWGTQLFPGGHPSRAVWVAFAAVALLSALLAGLVGSLSSSREASQVPLSDLVKVLQGDKASSLVLDEGQGLADVTLTTGHRHVVAEYPASLAPRLTQLALDHDVVVRTDRTTSATDQAGAVLAALLPVGLLVLVLLWLRHSSGAGLPGRSRRRHEAVVDIPDTRFADVAGAAEAVADLAEMVDFLRDGERFTRTGAKVPKGALLVGPPGTGKTLLARAVAGEAGVAFFSAAGSDFVEMFVGNGARRVRDLFEKARKAAPAIVFIDEIDAVARKRGSASSPADTERDGTLVALLHEMDGFTGSEVLVLAATNRPDVLDTAITRPGRLDRRIEVGLPDRRGRQAILDVHLAGKPLAADIDRLSLARRTPGFSGAQLAAVVNEACLLAAREHKDLVDQACLDAAVATVAMGRARTSALVTDHDRRVTAWHEAGHAVAAFVLPEADDPVQVTIVPRGPAGGVTWMGGNDDQFLPRRKAHAQLVVALAGRAAEMRLLDGEFTQGAHGDLTNATDLAVKMVTQYGMTDFGLAVRDAQLLASGGPMADAVMARVDGLLAAALDDAVELVAAHGHFLDAVAEALLDLETLSRSEIAELDAAVAVRR